MARDERAGGAGTELRVRVLSAAVLAPAALVAVLVGGLPFTLAVTLVGAVGFWEWTAVTDAQRPSGLRLGTLAVLAAGLAGLALSPGAGGFIATAAVILLLGGLRDRSSLWMGLGLAYVGLPCFALVMLRQNESSGLTAVLLILFVVWATDIGAYFGGRRFGGPKLAPRVSPGKTWSGAVSGLAAAALAGGATVWLLRAGGVAAGAAIALPLSVAAQAGDLLESAVKRRFGVKDSGRLIPGHGGILDRVDGLFGAAVIGLAMAWLGLGGAALSPHGVVIAASRP